MKIRSYCHKVQYYETDKMGIVHHSNYIRWMEEARVDYTDQLGWGLERMESVGLVSPVVSVECRYRAVTRFPELVTIDVELDEVRPVKQSFRYTMRRPDGEIVCTGRTEHCFIHDDGSIVRISREFPDYYAGMRAQLAEQDGTADA